MTGRYRDSFMGMLGPDEAFSQAWDPGYDEEPYPTRERDLGTLTMVVLMDNEVVDTVRRPVEGSGYECAALELGRGRPPRPEPLPPPPPKPPRHVSELSWLARLVGGAEALATRRGAAA